MLGLESLLFFVSFLMTQRLKTHYLNAIVPNLAAKFQYKNKHQVPKIEKIVINRGIGDASQNNKVLESFLNELGLIAGQKGVVTRSKKSIAGFKIREEMPVGVCVTLRGDRMYGFLDRLIHLALPRVRDFQGISPKSFDKNGNYSLGLEEQLMFPEIDYDKIDQLRGMDVSIVTTAKNQEEGLALLTEFGLPFKKA
jgi:large subunit ribosomal protein L5